MFVALDHAEGVLLGQEVVYVVGHRRVRLQDLGRDSVLGGIVESIFGFLIRMTFFVKPSEA